VQTAAAAAAAAAAVITNIPDEKVWLHASLFEICMWICDGGFVFS
jgi:hypothetical protein